MRSLVEYRETLERIGDGTVSTDFAREIIDAAVAEIRAAHGEYTITQAVEMSGRSRSWFERRLNDFRMYGLARQLPNGMWLLKAAALPGREHEGSGFDPALDVDEIARRVVGL